MKQRRFILAIVVAISCWGVTQEIAMEQAARPARWDGAHNVLFLGIGLYTKAGYAVRSYHDGAQRGADIDIFKDFPDAHTVLIEDAAASVADRTIFAVVLNFGDRIRHVLLTYDSGGKLLQILDTEPYYVQAVTTDDQGHIFTIANRLDEKPGNADPYPLLCEYDNGGSIIAEALTSKIFVNGSRAINPGREPGNAVLMLKDGKFFLYAPFESEFVMFSKDGTILKRARLYNLLHKIAKDGGLNEVVVRNLVFIDENRIALDLNGHIDKDQPSVPSTVIVNINTMQYKRVIGKDVRDWRLFGSADGHLLTIGKDKDKAVFRKHELDAH